MKITKGKLRQIIREELLREYDIGSPTGSEYDTDANRLSPEAAKRRAKTVVQILDPTALTTVADPEYREQVKQAGFAAFNPETTSAKTVGLYLLTLAAAAPLVGKAIGISARAARKALASGGKAATKAGSKALAQASPKAVKQTLDYVEEVATIPIRKPGKPPATVRDRIAQYGKSYTSDLPRLGDEIIFSASPDGGVGRSYGVVAGYANKPGVGRVIVVDVQGGRLYRPMVTPADLSKMSILVKRAKPRYSSATIKPGLSHVYGSPAKLKPPEDAVYGARTYLDP